MPICRISDCLTTDYPTLVAVRKRGLRNRNWFRLSIEDRGLYGCAMWVARTQNGIVNMKLLVRVLGIVLRLMENLSTRVRVVGRERAEELKQCFEERGLFSWAPQVRTWLGERSFTLYLGMSEIYAF